MEKIKYDVCTIHGDVHIRMETIIKPGDVEDVIVADRYTFVPSMDVVENTREVIRCVNRFHEYKDLCISEYNPYKRSFEETAQLYAEFCVRCDRAGLPLVNFNDWNKEINFK